MDIRRTTVIGGRSGADHHCMSTCFTCCVAFGINDLEQTHNADVVRSIYIELKKDARDLHEKWRHSDYALSAGAPDPVQLISLRKDMPNLNHGDCASVDIDALESFLCNTMQVHGCAMLMKGDCCVFVMKMSAVPEFLYINPHRLSEDCSSICGATTNTYDAIFVRCEAGFIRNNLINTWKGAHDMTSVLFRPEYFQSVSREVRRRNSIVTEMTPMSIGSRIGDDDNADWDDDDEEDHALHQAAACMPCTGPAFMYLFLFIVISVGILAYIIKLLSNT